jgi:hypothetical protein
MKKLLNGIVAFLTISNKKTMTEEQFSKHIMNLRYFPSVHYELTSVRSAFGIVHVVRFYNKETFDIIRTRAILIEGE